MEGRVDITPAQRMARSWIWILILLSMEKGGGGGRGGGRGLARIAPLERPRTVGVPICCTSLSVIRIHTSEIVLRCLGDVTRVYRKSGIVRCCKLLDMGDKVASWIIYHYTLFSYILGSCSLTRIHIFAVCCLSSGGWSIDFLPLSIPLPWTRWLPSYVFIKEDTVSEMHWVHSYALNPPLCPLRAASVLHLLAKQSLSSPIGSFYAIKKNSCILFIDTHCASASVIRASRVCFSVAMPAEEVQRRREFEKGR
jgi:hypothetical protein